MATTYFDTVNGQILSEYTGSTQLDYLSDALGSVTGVCDQTGSLVGSVRFKPYGATLSQSGTGPTVAWVGTRHYQPTDLAHSEYYVEARHKSNIDGRWTSVDPLWPRQPAYIYAGNRPVSEVDPTGLNPQQIQCVLGSRIWDFLLEEHLRSLSYSDCLAYAQKIGQGYKDKCDSAFERDLRACLNRSTVAKIKQCEENASKRYLECVNSIRGKIQWIIHICNEALAKIGT